MEGRVEGEGKKEESDTLCKATVSHSESHTTRAEWFFSGEKNRYIVDIKL